MFSIKHMAVVSALALAPVSASADLLNFSFEGFVERTNDGDNQDVASIGAFNVDDLVSGSFQLDTSLFTGVGTTSTSASGAISNFSLTIDGITYSSSSTGTATIRDNHMAGTSAPLRDMFLANVVSGVTGPTQDGLSAVRMQFSLGGTDALGVLSSLAVPTIAQFNDLFLNDNNDGNTKFLSFDDGSDVRYDVTSLEITTAPVPLPAPALLLLAGLGGLGALRRRKG